MYIETSNKKLDYQEVFVSGSKSITIRALFCAFLSDTPSTIENFNYSEDVLATIDCLNKLGGNIKIKGNILLINKRKVLKNEVFHINVKSSATLLRFILPLFVVLYPNKELYISLNDDLLNRPMDTYVDLFKKENIEFKLIKNKYYLKGEFKNELISVSNEISSQFISGLLLALPKRNCDSILNVTLNKASLSYILLTIRVMQAFGVEISSKEISGNATYKGTHYLVEGDYSNASLLIALALNKKETTFKNLRFSHLQGDEELIEILEVAGAKIKKNPTEIKVFKSRLSGMIVDIDKNIDLAPVLFALAVSCKDKSVFRNISRLKYKESNRLKEMLKIFDKLGVRYELDEETLVVYPSVINSDTFIEVPNDHRIVHALILLNSFNKSSFIITNYTSMNKSDLNMLKTLEKHFIDIKYSKKPKVLISIKDLDELNLNADGYVMGYEKYTLFAPKYFAYREIKKAQTNKNVFVLLNAMIHQNELNKFIREVKKLAKLNISFIVQDIGAVNVLKSIISEERIIFYPYTLICQKGELDAYKKQANVSIGISNEITLLDTYYTLKNSDAFVTVFGYIPMYQSYRKVLSMYEEYISRPIKRDNLLLKEDLRNDFYHINENQYGSVIFRPYVLSYLENIDYVLEAKYIFLDSNYIPKNVFKKVLSLTYLALEGKNIKSEITKLPLNIKDGFKYQDSIYKEKSL